MPENGDDLNQRWIDELRELGFSPPFTPTPFSPSPVVDHAPARPGPVGVPIGGLDRDAAVDLALSRLGARRSSRNSADIRGEVDRIIAGVGVVATAQVRGELAEDLTTRAVDRCVSLLARDDVPEHVRSLTSPHVLQVEADLTARLASRADRYGRPVRIDGPTVKHLDPAQRSVVDAAASLTSLIVIEGAAGSGKTATLAAARAEMAQYEWRLVVVTPTLKAAHVAEEQVGADAFSAAWLIHKHGYRWDDDGNWTRVPAHPNARARLRPGDLLLADEAGMLDQDTAWALLTIADEATARVAFVVDRHQLPAVGRGGVLDHAERWAHPNAKLTLDTVHRFTDPQYAELTLLMRTGERPNEVFDLLLKGWQVAIYPSDVERLAALTSHLTTEQGVGDLVIADT